MSGGSRMRRDSDSHRHRRGDRDDGGGSRRDGGGGGSTIPEVNHIFQGTVVSIMEYGAFIRIPGCIKNGLVHKSQLSKCRVDHVNEVVSVNDRVWCKVISLGEDSNKISLSMKSVNQGNGQDLDPNGVQAGLDENRRNKTYTPFSQPKITLDAVLNTVCKKCNTKGHLAQNCFQSSSGKAYQLIGDGDEDNDDKRGSSADASPAAQTRKKEHKKHKAKKHKEHKKRKAKKSRAHSSDDDNESRQPSRKRNKEGTKKRKRERQSSTSSSSSSSSPSMAAQESSKKLKEH